MTEFDIRSLGGGTRETVELGGVVVHPDWCEWSGPIPAISLRLTGDTIYRCPGCWAGAAAR